MGHKHNVYDGDTHFIIDPVTRAVTNERSKKVTLIQYDHNSERFTFDCPRYIEGHDMSMCTKVEVHFLNVDAKTQEKKTGLYEPKDLQVKSDDEDTVTCSWLISANATQLVGTLSFIIRYLCVEGGEVLYAWNTAINSNILVASSINASEPFETEYVDIIEQWKASVMQTFADDLTVWKNDKAAELEADLTEWKEAESDEVHRVMGDYEIYMNKQLDVERKRIDAFVALKDGSTTGDAELQDIRVGTSGEVYSTAGNAVREQANRIKKQFYNLLDGIIDPCGQQVLDFSKIAHKVSIDIYTGVSVETNEEYYAIDTPMLIDRKQVHYLIYDKNTRTYLYFYDQNETFLGYVFVDDSRKLDDFPENSKYVKIVFIRNSEDDDVPSRNIWLLEGSPKTTSTLILNDGNVSEEKCSFFVRDLLNQEEVEYNMVFNPAYGNPYEAADRSLTGFIDVTNVAYITTNFTFYVAFYDENFVFISDIADTNKHEAGTYAIPEHEQLKYARLIFITSDSALISTYHISNCEEMYDGKMVLRKSCLPEDIVENVTKTEKISNQVSACEAALSAIDTNWYAGKTITAFGDSITEGNKWQPYVADKLSCTMVNCGIGGTTVANNGKICTYNGVDIESWMCSDDRINLIPEETDMIILFGGANDWAQSAIAMGELGDGKLIDNTFKSAYSLMIKKLVNKFPNAKLIALTLINGRTSTEDANEDKQHCVRNLCLYDFSVAIKEICMYFGIPCIDIHGESGINTFNHTTYIADIVHPNNEGGKMIANAVINGLKRFEPIDF